MYDERRIEPLTDPPDVRPPRRWQDTGREAILLLPNVVKLLARLMRDPRVPVRRKVFAASVMVYVVSPIDIIPDIIPGLGKFDDILLAALAVDHLIGGAGDDVIADHWDGSEDSLDLLMSVADWSAEIIPGPLRALLPD
jgi:uncharacterized membrane protein YkvA (DUF1232 family)